MCVELSFCGFSFSSAVLLSFLLTFSPNEVAEEESCSEEGQLPGSY